MPKRFLFFNINWAEYLVDWKIMHIFATYIIEFYNNHLKNLKL